MRGKAGSGRHADDGLAKADIDEDGSVRSLQPVAPFAVEKGTVRFDVTDAVFAAAGMDPYQSRKRKLLDDTRSDRAQMATTARSRRLRQSLVRTKRMLAELWSRPDLGPEGKRELIFSLWDECAEEGSAEVVASAQAVRATIETFVRRELPRKQGYSEAELARLNAARQSRATFAPYR